ncbi:MAG: hypothetical protein AAFR20_01085 [Pseudomonadota bacterium]
MRPLFFLSLLTLILGGCATQPLNIETSDYAFKTAGGDDDFKKFLDEIGKDQATLLRYSRNWEKAETAAGLGLLASAAYGGFSTTFGGGGNVTDAAFAATTITGLRGFGRTGDRRDAARQAANRLLCVRNAAGAFVGKTPTKRFLTTTATKAQRQMMGLGADLIASDIVTRPGKGATEGQQDIRLFNALLNAQTDETRNWDNRFVIVGTAVNQIISAWREGSKSAVQNFEGYLAQYRMAVMAMSEAEDNQEAVMRAAMPIIENGRAGSQILTVVSMENPYAKAQEAVIACAGKDGM